MSLHSGLPINFQIQTYHCPFLFCKVLYSKLSNKLALKRNIRLRNKVNNNGFLLVTILTERVILLVTIEPSAIT